MNAAVRPLRPFDRDGDSPNSTIDEVIKSQLDKAKSGTMPAEMVVKILAQAIAWEKVKHHITDKDEDFDPDAE
jgi:hypothetical protein